LANTFNSFGFRSFGHRDGSAPTMGLERRFISSATTGPIFTGDAVINSSGALGSYIVAGGSTGNGATAVPAVSSPLIGVFAGCEYYNTNVNRVTWSSYWPGSGATGDITAYVITDPEMTYLVQGTSAAVIGTSQIGACFPMTISSAITGTGNTLTGQSVMAIQSSLPTGLSSNGQFILVDLYSNFAPPGVNGTSTGAEGAQMCIVQPANAIRRTIGGVGAAATFST